jgi:hypothetical protein
VPDIDIALTEAEHRQFERIAEAKGITVEQLTTQLAKDWLAKRFLRPVVQGKVIQMRPRPHNKGAVRGRD